jgi:hypothetical protein
MATIESELFVGSTYALTSTPDGAVPDVPTRFHPGRTKREKLPITHSRFAHTLVPVSYRQPLLLLQYSHQ